MKKKYLWLSVFILGILSFIYIIKGIFPFGNESIIWSDMHEQITAIYYHFYDAIRGNSSLLVDFTSGGGINFVGILAYYILSPFTLILLLFPRDLVENAVSIVVDAYGNDGDILFLPITYLDGYKSNTHSIFRVFDNFLGIRLNDGNNHIEIDYVPKGMIAGILFSILGIILFILWEKYYYLFDINILNNIFYFIYLFIYFVIIFAFYILMPLFFIKSFF